MLQNLCGKTAKSSDFWGSISTLYNSPEFGFKFEKESHRGTILLLNYSTLWDYIGSRWRWNSTVKNIVFQE